MPYQPPPKRAFTIIEVARRWNANRQTIEKMVRSGKLPAFRVGREWRVGVAIVEAVERGEDHTHGHVLRKGR